MKEQVRKAHQELVDKGYMQELSSLPQSTQDIIASTPFCHFYPWRAVYKDDSVTTPVRLVVDELGVGEGIGRRRERIGWRGRHWA